MKRRDIVNIIILMLVIVVAVIRYKAQSYTETRSRFMMDTLVELSFTARGRDLPSVMDSTIDLISYYERKFSYYDPEGALWAINHSEEDSISIDGDLYELLNLAESFYYETDGLYDITIGALTELWDIERSYPPPADSIRAAMENIGFDKISYGIDHLIRPQGLKINLGSVAKGYILDKAVEYAKSEGVSHGFINAGGDILLFGDPGRDQRIGIQHPRDVNDIIAVLALRDRSVVTSGDYERYFEYEARRYHHIINPLEGYPVENLFSVTVIAPNATLGDILSTAVFLLPPEEGIDLVKTFPGVECIIFYSDDEEIVSLRTEGTRDLIVSGL